MQRFVAVCAALALVAGLVALTGPAMAQKESVLLLAVWACLPALIGGMFFVVVAHELYIWYSNSPDSPYISKLCCGLYGMELLVGWLLTGQVSVQPLLTGFLAIVALCGLAVFMHASITLVRSGKTKYS